MGKKIEKFSCGETSKEKMTEIFQGWNAYAKWANIFNLRKRIFNLRQTFSSRDAYPPRVAVQCSDRTGT